MTDARWETLAKEHPSASIFHQRGWLEALSRTYRYEPFVISKTPAGRPLEEGVVFCSVSSWITGTRLVSLPFADHCAPLLTDSGSWLDIWEWLGQECAGRRWRYAELRPLFEVVKAAGVHESATYFFHELDLTPSLECIFKQLHKTCIQRKVLRAGKEGLSCERGNSDELLSDFYRLQLMTRRRHRLLPQPRAWFRNLLACLPGQSEIMVARKDGRAIAAMMILRHGTTVTYKYGCSDDRFHALGSMPYLFWALIETSKAAGAERIDFGRSDLEHKGLVQFKDRLGAAKRLASYYRYEKDKSSPEMKWDSEIARQFFCLLPNRAFSAAGQLVYRHLG